MAETYLTYIRVQPFTHRRGAHLDGVASVFHNCGPEPTTPAEVACALSGRMLRALLCLVLLSFSLIACRPGGVERGLAPGQRPPSIEFPTLNGEMLSLDSLKGKFVLVNFWASWCAPCVAEMPELQKLYTELAPEGFAVLAVGVEDSPENLAKVQKRFGLTFPIVVDRTGQSKGAYRLAGFPETFFVNAEGLVSMVVDPDTSEPTVRIIGPREWSRDPARSMIKQLLPLR